MERLISCEYQTMSCYMNFWLIKTVVKKGGYGSDVNKQISMSMNDNFRISWNH